MKAVILARVSSKEQEEGYSLDAQKDRLINYCNRNNLEVIKTFTIIESSTQGTRKNFNEMLNFAKTKINHCCRCRRRRPYTKKFQRVYFSK